MKVEVIEIQDKKETGWTELKEYLSDGWIPRDDGVGTDKRRLITLTKPEEGEEVRNPNIYYQVLKVPILESTDLQTSAEDIAKGRACRDFSNILLATGEWETLHKTSSSLVIGKITPPVKDQEQFKTPVMPSVTIPSEETLVIDNEGMHTESNKKTFNVQIEESVTVEDEAEPKPEEESPYDEQELGCVECNQNEQCPAATRTVLYDFMKQMGDNQCSTFEQRRRQ